MVAVEVSTLRDGPPFAVQQHERREAIGISNREDSKVVMTCQHVLLVLGALRIMGEEMTPNKQGANVDGGFRVGKEVVLLNYFIWELVDNGRADVIEVGGDAGGHYVLQGQSSRWESQRLSASTSGECHDSRQVIVDRIRPEPKFEYDRQ